MHGGRCSKAQNSNRSPTWHTGLSTSARTCESFPLNTKHLARTVSKRLAASKQAGKAACCTVGLFTGSESEVESVLERSHPGTPLQHVQSNRTDSDFRWVVPRPVELTSGPSDTKPSSLVSTRLNPSRTGASSCANRTDDRNVSQSLMGQQTLLRRSTVQSWLPLQQVLNFQSTGLQNSGGCLFRSLSCSCSSCSCSACSCVVSLALSESFSRSLSLSLALSLSLSLSLRLSPSLYISLSLSLALSVFVFSCSFSCFLLCFFCFCFFSKRAGIDLHPAWRPTSTRTVKKQQMEECYCNKQVSALVPSRLLEGRYRARTLPTIHHSQLHARASLTPDHFFRTKVASVRRATSINIKKRGLAYPTPSYPSSERFLWTLPSSTLDLRIFALRSHSSGL